MTRRSQRLFLLLVVAQAMHSTEEYVTRLYDVFAPAQFLSGLVSDDLAMGFLVLNVCVVAIGVWCCVVPVRSGRAGAWVAAWVWTVIELANGLGHGTLALQAGGYFPGALTGVLLLGVAGSLALSLRADRKHGLVGVSRA